MKLACVTGLTSQHDTSETRDIDFMDYPIEQQRKYGHPTFTVLRPVG